MPPEGASGLWRSEDMVRLDIITQREVLHETVLRLGLIGKAQFVDLNEDMTAFMRPYTPEIRHLDELERKLSVVAKELERVSCLEKEEECAPPFKAQEDILSLMRLTMLDEVEERVNTVVAELHAVNESLQGLRREINYNHELSLLHTRLQELMPSRTVQSFAADVQTPHVLGVIAAEKAEILYAVVYRATKGNSLIELDNRPVMLLDPDTGERCVAKTPFAVFAPSPGVLERVERLLGSLGATVHTMSGVSHQTREELNRSMEELQLMYGRVEQRKMELLTQHNRHHRANLRFVQIEKQVFAQMNFCAVSGTTCTASVWIPQKYEEALSTALKDAVHASSGSVPSVVSPHLSQCNPPTYFETNAFTESFQSIVDSYGMARYKEVNPGVFTIVTFPYLFGIMYGDIGHGMLLMFFALYFIAMERSWRGYRLNEILAMLFGGRYLLLLMSLFSIYMGALYNDFFGFSVGMFSSAYSWPPIAEQKGTVEPTEVQNQTRVYLFGLDAAWAETENKLEFYNSVKMKCAVIVGVLQMLTGNVLSLLNYLRNREFAKILFLFIPETVFLLCTFGYMSVAIVIKWCTRWENTSEAPSILETMTNFFLQPGTVTQPLFNGQAVLQLVFLLVAFAMVPVMLVMMPLVELRKERRRRAEYAVLRDGASMRSIGAGDGRQHTSSVLVGSRNVSPADGVDFVPSRHSLTAPDDVYSNSGNAGVVADVTPHFDFSEVAIHYVIHTIEYVLGCVSNTASYLRLWALSLAHAQLSEVFFTFAVVKVLGMDTTGVFTAAGIAVWLGVTLAVLVGMEALSAFLHALRLHWVEFNNKFYAADGVAMEPFNLMNNEY